MTLKTTCASCGGLGYRGEGSEESCEDCGGTGFLLTASQPAIPQIPCPDCSNGNIIDSEGYTAPCLTCHGTGKVEVTEENDPYPDGPPPEDSDYEAVDDEPQASEGEPAGEVDPAAIF